MITSMCVYCGSSPGRSEAYGDAARALAEALCERSIGLVYGGATVGVMGMLADRMVQLGGRVTGVMPRSLLDKEIGHPHLTEMHVVSTMHERKQLMIDLAEGFIAMPGGAGTLEEVFEVWTWGQLGFHTKPVGFLNVAGYFDRLVGFLDHAMEEQFIRPAHRSMLIVEEDPVKMLSQFSSYQAPVVSKWVDGP